MKKLTSSEIRSMFLEFFKEKGHKVERSASLVPVDDPTLLWINSGVATLKNILMVQLFQVIRVLQVPKKAYVPMTSKTSD